MIRVQPVSHDDSACSVGEAFRETERSEFPRKCTLCVCVSVAQKVPPLLLENTGSGCRFRRNE